MSAQTDELQTLQVELQDLKAELTFLQDTLKTLREEYAIDGVIDADEQAEIDELEEIVRQTQAQRDELEAEFAQEEEDGGLSDLIGDALGDAWDTAKDWADTSIDSAKKALDDAGLTSANPGESPVIAGGIKAKVGKGGKNDPNDVRIVQYLLVKAGKTVGTSGPNGDGVDGDCGNKTVNAIKSFQQEKFGWQDGLVEVGGDTWNALFGPSSPDDPTPSLGAPPQSPISFIVEDASGVAVRGAYIALSVGDAPAAIASELPVSPIVDLVTKNNGRAETTLYDNCIAHATYKSEINFRSHQTAPVNIFIGAGGPQTVTLTFEEDFADEQRYDLEVLVVDENGRAVHEAAVTVKTEYDGWLPGVTDTDGRVVYSEVRLPQEVEVQANAPGTKKGGVASDKLTLTPPASGTTTKLTVTLEFDDKREVALDAEDFWEDVRDKLLIAALDDQLINWNAATANFLSRLKISSGGLEGFWQTAGPFASLIPSGGSEISGIVSAFTSAAKLVGGATDPKTVGDLELAFSEIGKMVTKQRDSEVIGSMVYEFEQKYTKPTDKPELNDPAFRSRHERFFRTMKKNVATTEAYLKQIALSFALTYAGQHSNWLDADPTDSPSGTLRVACTKASYGMDAMWKTDYAYIDDTDDAVRKCLQSLEPPEYLDGLPLEMHLSISTPGNWFAWTKKVGESFKASSKDVPPDDRLLKSWYEWTERPRTSDLTKE